MFSFINNSMGTVTQRFITYALGKDDKEYLKCVFSTSVTIFFIIAILIIILAETLGLWFFYHKMQIPTERINIAFWVYQFSILSLVIGMFLIPYNSTIIGHEKMSIFAYFSIIEVTLKLAIVFALVLFPIDKLFLYSILIVAIQLFMFSCYQIYCKKHFEECIFKLHTNKQLFKNMFIFSGWTMTGSFSVICYTQGLNILLNIFFGPIVNAARGIAVQVQTVIRNFCTNFQIAINPQIVKSFVQHDVEHLHTLIIMSSKFSFFLIFILSLPIILETTFVLKCWLGIVPEHTENFIRIILATSMIIAISNPLITALQAKGEVKKFQIAESSVLICIPIVSYLLLKFTTVPPESVFIVHLCFEICAQCVRVKIILPHIQMNTVEYLQKVVSPILKVTCISPILPALLYYIFPDKTFFSFFIVTIISILSVTLSAYYLGCTNKEQEIIKELLKKYIQKKM